MKVIGKIMKQKQVIGISMFSDEKVSIIGEQTVVLDDGRIIEQYIYNIVGHAAGNGKPFISLKSNIII